MDSINLQYREYVFEQLLDYELLPFRCHRCHEIGHLARDCPMGRRRRRIQKPVEQRERSMGDDINMTWKNSSEDKSTEGVHPQEDDALAQTEEAPIQAAENLSGVEEPHGEITEAAAIDLSGKQTIPPNSVCFPESNTVLSSMESPLHSNCKDICK